MVIGASICWGLGVLQTLDIDMVHCMSMLRL